MLYGVFTGGMSMAAQPFGAKKQERQQQVTKYYLYVRTYAVSSYTLQLLCNDMEERYTIAIWYPKYTICTPQNIHFTNTVDVSNKRPSQYIVSHKHTLKLYLNTSQCSSLTPFRFVMLFQLQYGQLCRFQPYVKYGPISI